MAPDFREARFNSCTIVQLPQPSHSPHSPSADYSTCTDTSVLHGIPSSNIQNIQRVQDSAAWIILQPPMRSHTKPLLCQLHWLPVQHRITYKLADSMLGLVMTTRLSEPFASTAFAKRVFRCSVPATWNSAKNSY